MQYTARVSFNTNYWQKPSGPIGKSPSGGSAFEAQYGFGYEEWIFCRRNQFPEDGSLWQYGYLQGLSKNTKDLKESNDIDLWALEFKSLKVDERNPRYFVRTIKNWKYVDQIENQKLIDKKPAIVEAMEAELMSTLDGTSFLMTALEHFRKASTLKNDQQLFNIKFPVMTRIDVKNPIYAVNMPSFHLYTDKNIREV